MGEKLKVAISSSIKHIECNGYGDEILIDVSDASVFERFNSAYDELNKLQEEWEKENDQLPEGDDPDTLFLKAQVRVKFVHKMIAAIDMIFGRDTIRKVFRENYEHNEDFLPGEDLIVEFLEQMIPIMEDLYKKRAENVRSKYSHAKRGKKR